ncbi:MAG: ComEC/Rec2 family competence protein, partial [Tepidimonas sp.]|uniref:ComEC/Rec2 family competence protein n=1 Tax=Tepidimonas sp. TaxID=2002775 RepID=UPI004054B278
LWPVLAYQPAAPAPGTFDVLLPDVGQGSAAIVRTARHTLVYDGGPPMGSSDAAERVLLPWLRALGARPSAIVVSHDDHDHAGGITTLAQAYPQATWWASFDASARIGRHSRPCTAGEGWEWDGVRFVFLHPPVPDYGAAGAAGDNARSCVLLVGTGSNAALLPGDITQAEEAALLQAYPGLRTGLLVLAHHGSKTSTSAAWLDGTQPRAVVAQAGWRNRYGHPHPAVVERVRSRAAAWANTAECGAVSWHSSAPERLECERRKRRTYWAAAAGG